MLAFVPALPPPSDITPNFIDPYTRAPIQVAVTSIMLALAVLFFLNRVYVKLCLTKKLYWDDATIVLAMVSILCALCDTSVTLLAWNRCLLRCKYLV